MKSKLVGSGWTSVLACSLFLSPSKLAAQPPDNPPGGRRPGDSSRGTPVEEALQRPAAAARAQIELMDVQRRQLHEQLHEQIQQLKEQAGEQMEQLRADTNRQIEHIKRQTSKQIEQLQSQVRRQEEILEAQKRQIEAQTGVHSQAARAAERAPAPERGRPEARPQSPPPERMNRLLENLDRLERRLDSLEKKLQGERAKGQL